VRHRGGRHQHQRGKRYRQYGKFIFQYTICHCAAKIRKIIGLYKSTT
jgi:hypothetical protein